MASKEYKRYEQQEYNRYVKDHISCPACGKKYGHHKTKACLNCSECSKCCSCKEPNIISAQEMINITMEEM